MIIPQRKPLVLAVLLGLAQLRQKWHDDYMREQLQKFLRGEKA
jgi:hypothetical protein